MEPDDENVEADRVELEYVKGRVVQYASEFEWELEEESQDDEGWQGFFSSEFEEDGRTRNEMMLVQKPMGAPYVKFEFWVPIDPLFFKSKVKEIIGIISDFGLCIRLDEDMNDPEKLVLQISIRVFVPNFNLETFEYVTENLFACKDALLEYIEENDGDRKDRRGGRGRV